VQKKDLHPLRSYRNLAMSNSNWSSITVHESRVVTTAAHHRDNQNIVTVDVKMNDVGKTFQSTGPQSVCSDREQKRIVANALDRSQIFEQEFAALARSLVVIPSNGVNDIGLNLWAVRQSPHYWRFSTRRDSSSGEIAVDEFVR